MRTRHLLRALFGLLVLAGWVTPACLADGPRRPNVVLILVDDMGYADLGCMGAKDIRTPNIDRLAQEGVKLTNFYSAAPVCTPTRAAFMTGRYQQRVGLEWALGFTAEQYRRKGDKWIPEPDKYAPGLPPSESVLARLLRALGYYCGILGKWHLGFLPEFNPTRHGFHEYFGVLTGHADYYSYRYFDGTFTLRENDKPGKAEGYLTDLLNRKAVDFINRRAKEPFFLYVPHLAVHFPFQVPDRPGQVLTKQNYNDGTRKDYIAMLERVDRGVGMILDALDKNGVAENTLVIFSSDNGGYRLSDNGPLFHHKATLWEGGVRVPCLMRWPARLPKGQVISQMGITMDLTATILTAAGAELPKERKLDGIDLMPILTGKQKEVERTFFWRIDRSDRKQNAVRQGRWKYLKDGAIEMLFDLQEDISERRNLGYRHPEIVERLRRLHAEWAADVDRNPPPMRVK
ncbi:MAG: sulfatase [Gemmataceae bacterium]|nr:sulfatase [Gemmataceae bacterium]